MHGLGLGSRVFGADEVLDIHTLAVEENIHRRGRVHAGDVGHADAIDAFGEAFGPTGDFDAAVGSAAMVEGDLSATGYDTIAGQRIDRAIRQPAAGADDTEVEIRVARPAQDE